MFILLIIILSFFLDGICSNLLLVSNLCYPLFSLLCLIVIYPYYRKKEINKFYITGFIIGLVYDIVYTNTLFLNACFFLAISFFTKQLYDLLKISVYSTVCISLFIIICYRLFIYLILLFTRCLDFNIDILYKSIYCSLLINLVYILLFYYSTKIISKRLHLYIQK